MFARQEGAVAAPTAGLHFTPELAAALQARGIALHRVTLHVGAGTFLPVKAADTADHRMHGERGSVSPGTAAALNGLRRAGGRVVAGWPSPPLPRRKPRAAGELRSALP